MATTATAPSSAGTRAARYREAERRLWDHYGLEPEERLLELDDARLRVLEVGSGPPVLFVHGTVGLGAWPPLLRELPGFRALVLERPGWGPSSPVDFARRPYRELAADLLRDALDALGLERVAVVGGSIGDVWALALAARHPARVSRVALLGAGPIVAEAGVPGIIRLLASPVGAVMVRMPDSPGRIRSILRRSGHGPSLDGGLIPDELVDWRAAAGRETDSMRHEREMVRAIVDGRSYRPGLTFAADELAAIRQPVLQVYGTADPVGSVDVREAVVRRLPAGELLLLDSAGHMPWLDEPGDVAAALERFLAEG